MKKLFVRATLPLFLCTLILLSAFSPHPRANAFPLAVKTAFAASAETPPPYPSYPAAGDYACVLSGDTFLYSAADGRKGLFLLPKSYYVRLIEYGSDYCKVEYQRNESDAKRVVGYAKTAELTFVDYVPVRPYLYYVFDVTYTIEDAETEDSSFLTQITLSCVYYGDYRVGSELYCYVLRGDEFGYIPKPLGVSYEKNTEYEDYLASLTPPQPEKPEPSVDENAASPTQIAILIAICLLVPVLAAMILKPPRRPLYETEE